jgi:hypothetical protein
MGASGVSKSQVSRLVAEIDERVNAFLRQYVLHTSAPIDDNRCV